MITRCNQCSAKFEISAELLQSVDPTVRCGECLSVFDARAQLVRQASPESGSATPTGRAKKTNATKRQSVGEVATAEQFSTTDIYSNAGTSIPEYAHINDDDLESAATILLDDSEAVGSGEDSRVARDTGSSRINDGFYSPDLNAGEPAPGKGYNVKSAPVVEGKIDPSIDTGSLDETSLEFESTLALNVDAQSYTNPDPIVSSGADAPARRFAHSGDERQIQSGLSDDRITGDETKSALPESPLPEIPLSEAMSGAGYSTIPDNVLSAPPVSYNTDSRENSSYQKGYREAGYREAGYDNNHNDPEHDRQDSASDLRRYVNSRGGAVYPRSVDAADVSDKPRSMFVPLLTMSLLALGALFLARDTIARMNLPLPVLSVFCSVAACELPVQKDVEQLELVRHQMSAHKSLDDVLVISVDLINQAAFPQPYPVLVVTMANTEGQSVAYRKFQPEEYLDESAVLGTLPAREPIRIKFDIVDPGPDAMSSELSFE